MRAIHCQQKLDSARQDQDNALLLARQYRDMAEEFQKQKRQQRCILDGRIETVFSFCIYIVICISFIIFCHNRQRLVELLSVRMQGKSHTLLFAALKKLPHFSLLSEQKREDE